MLQFSKRQNPHNGCIEEYYLNGLFLFQNSFKKKVNILLLLINNLVIIEYFCIFALQIT